MNREKMEYTLSASVTFTEKSLLLGIAHEWGIAYSTIMKRLLLYILDGKMDMPSMFKRFQALRASHSEEKLPESDKVLLKVTISADLHLQLLNMADDWGSKPSLVMKALLQLFLAGQIEKRSIW